MTSRYSAKLGFPTRKAAAAVDLGSDADPPGELDVVKLVRPLRTKDGRHLEISDYTALPEIELPVGMTGVILDIDELPDKPTGYLIEFVDDQGRTIAWPHLPLEDFEVVERHCGRNGSID